MLNFRPRSKQSQANNLQNIPSVNYVNACLTVKRVNSVNACLTVKRANELETRATILHLLCRLMTQIG